MTTLPAATILLMLMEEDIEGLLEAGAPVDEYETEARMIAERLAELIASTGRRN